eukprot:GHVL01011391.1.p1 GENE.GHVL01011391.1~~GHVL01011391.1.p1  ORF type:complete len:210 (+),score=21.67 GHVL01011391.1:227-856(+)
MQLLLLIDSTIISGHYTFYQLCLGHHNTKGSHNILSKSPHYDLIHCFEVYQQCCRLLHGIHHHLTRIFYIYIYIYIYIYKYIYRRFSLGDGEFHGEVCSIVDRLQNNGSGHNGDFYLVCYDFPSYCDAQDKVDKTYNDPKLWWSLSIKAAASMGKFSTDRSMRDYRDNIWHIKEAARPDPREEESAVNMNEEGTHYSVAPQEKGKSGKK